MQHDLKESEAKNAVDKVWRGLKRNPSPADGGKVELVAKVVNPATPVEVRSKNPRDGDNNDALVLSLIYGVSNVEKRVTLVMLGQILSVLAYNELRTTRQLGYVVSAGSAMISNVHYISAVVQGNVQKADEVEALVELVFQEMMPARLRELSEEEFNSYVDSFKQELLQPPMTASEEVGQFWGSVKQGGRCFELRNEVLKFIASPRLNRQLLADTWAELAMPAEGNRKKLTVKYFAGGAPPRLSDEEAQKLWDRQGLSKNTTMRLMRERQATTVFSKADSKAREQLVKAGGYFPQNLECRFEDKPAPVEPKARAALIQRKVHSASSSPTFLGPD